MTVPHKKTVATHLGCIPKRLPAAMASQSIRTAVHHNPANAAHRAGTVGLPIERIALLTSKYWGPKGVKLGVTFLDTTDTTLKNKILAYANKWNQFGNIQFAESAHGEVRLSLGSGGYWSYLGTDILSIPTGQQTMNLEAFSLQTPDSEYDRVVCHEFGHTLGFPHEHERAEVIALLDQAKTVAWFAQNVGWDQQTVIEQVFTPLDPSDLEATAADQRSIMCYQFAAACTKSGQPIPGGDVIDQTDGTFAAQIYPKAVTPTNPTDPNAGGNGGTTKPGPNDTLIDLTIPNIPVKGNDGKVIGYVQSGKYASRTAPRTA